MDEQSTQKKAGLLQRAPQGEGTFEAGNPQSGYYNDLRGVALEYETPQRALGWFDLFEMRREFLTPVSMVQLGIGAWQLCQEIEGDERVEWIRLIGRIADWLVMDMDGYGRLAYHQDMAHTFELDAPWYSAMAQGQAASFLVRASHALDRPELVAHAARAIESLLDPDSSLVWQTSEGPVLQEYPTGNPSHVLNGWIFALWGLYDIANTASSDEGIKRRAQGAFDDGFAALERRLPMYTVGRGWSRYDLYPHPMTHYCSPFYHRLHIALLRAMNQLRPSEALAEAAETWNAALGRRTVFAGAVLRKVGFRLMRPRGRKAS